MRAYSVISEEALRARNLLQDWRGEGFLTERQYQLMQEELVCDLRRTNVFLRIVLFLFTLIIVGAATGLFLPALFSTSAQSFQGVTLLIFAVTSYAAAEFAVAEYRLYRHGIEEALAACSVGFLCAGIAILFRKSNLVEFLVPAAGASSALWIWHRFGLAYAFLAAMVFLIWMPHYWTASHSVQHLIVATLYAAGLIIIAGLRSRLASHADDEYSIAEALLWLGIYLAINLQVSPVSLFEHRWQGLRNTSDFSGTFFWFTWALTWCIPPAVLWRGLRRKDRFVIAVGGIVAVLTLITNKSYLGWERHTWDPMLLGVLLVGVALVANRWLASGPSGIRHGFTARRLSGKNKQWLDTGSLAFGMVAQDATLANSHTGSTDFRFDGGQSGGGGASSDF